MRIVNNTPYDGKVIKRIARLVAAHHRVMRVYKHSVLYLEPAPWGREPRVQMKHDPGFSDIGKAEDWQRHIVLHLPRPGTREDITRHVAKQLVRWREPVSARPLVAAVARSLTWALLHGSGGRHDRSVAWIGARVPELMIPVRASVLKPKAKPDKREVRYKRLLAREKAWSTKLKRAQTALAKIARARKRYEREAA